MPILAIPDLLREEGGVYWNVARMGNGRFREGVAL